MHYKATTFSISTIYRHIESINAGEICPYLIEVGSFLHLWQIFVSFIWQSMILYKILFFKYCVFGRKANRTKMEKKYLKPLLQQEGNLRRKKK